MPSLDDGEPCKPRMAGLLAIHLVSQILDEAYVIANAAEDSGQPWRYLSMLKNLRSGKLGDIEEDISFEASQGDSDVVNENKVEQIANNIATSTPEKASTNDGSPKPKTEPTLIGQGDEEFDMRQSDLSKSTSMFINHLFDMSEVERVVIGDDTEILESNPIPRDMLTEAMMTIMESYVNTAFNIAFEQDPQVDDLQTEKSPRSHEHSCYTFLADAFGGGIVKDIAFYIDEEMTSTNNNNYEILEVTEELPGITEDVDIHNEYIEEDIKKNDVAFYENAYLTLNRDYDQCSDDDAEPVLQDPKGMMLQEVELISANSSEENLSAHPNSEPEARKELAAISGVSGVSSRKSKTSLISRCRSQGAKLLSCLRGWWRRKTPGKRKEARPHGSIRGICPLSPDARRRASSLLDQRNLCSPTPSRSMIWKFNTVNETLVNSSRWKEYTFDMKPDECGEY